MTTPDDTPTSVLPLFPLRVVLLPGGALDLRIFETRYLDMVRDCGRTGTGFGVCLIVDGQEAGVPAVPAPWGTEARIEDFGSTPEGLLALRVRGMRRFQVLATRVRPNGLLEGDVAFRAPDPDDELRPEHGLIGSLLQQAAEHAGGALAGVHPPRFDDAAWVGWRFADAITLSDAQRLALLQEDDPHARLDLILRWIS